VVVAARFGRQPVLGVVEDLAVLPVREGSAGLDGCTVSAACRGSVESATVPLRNPV